MNIGYDLDGVVFKLGACLNKYILDKYNHVIDVTKVAEYSDFIKLVEGYKKGAVNDFLEGDEGHILRVEPYEGAVEIINKRFNEGHKIYFITARHNEDTVLKALRLRGILYTNIFFIHADNKHEVIKDLGLYTYIDDRIETLFSICDKKIPLIPVVRDQPWNRKPHQYLGIVRVDDLYGYDEFIEQVLEIHRLSID